MVLASPRWASRARIAARLARLEMGNSGDVGPVGEGVSELRLHFGPGYRIYFVQRGREFIILLCGGDKSTQPADIAEAKRLAKEQGAMSDKTTLFDAADYLETPDEIAAFLDEALAMDDPAFFAHALGIASRAKGMSEVAEIAGVKREALYRALSEAGNPQLSTLFGVLKALGLRMHLEPV